MNTVKQVIIDFDNTMGVPGCDVDDGLALLFLLGDEEAEVLGVCTTYGNSTIDVVHGNTVRLFAELGVEIPVYRGCASPDGPATAASRYLADTIGRYPGEISLVATGSLTNLKRAARLSPAFPDRLEGVHLMGGITETLVIDGTVMDELNFSCDPEATACVLGASCTKVVATAQSCLPSYFTRDDFIRRCGEDSWLYRTCGYWFDDMERAGYGQGFVCWDVVTAATVTHPELFEWDTADVTLSNRFLGIGYLETAPEGAPSAPVTIPRIVDADRFRECCFDNWNRALAKLGVE